MILRPAREEDLPQVLALYGELSAYQRDWRVFEPRRSELDEAAARFRDAAADPQALLLVAEQEGRLVGMGLGHVRPVSTYSEELALDISNVVVAASHRGSSVGRAIVDALAAFGREKGVTRATVRVFAENARAVDFWERLGFRPRLVQLVADL